MVQDPLLECSFLIPLRGDADMSNGVEHGPEIWEWLDIELYDRFRGVTYSPVIYQGSYQDVDSGDRVFDDSKKCIVAVPNSRLDELRKLLSAACVLFQQKCIYLSVAGTIEFIGPPHDSD